MTGVIDVGGGMRAIYGAGVFDYCMDHGISFDDCTGISAGAANISSYVAGQRGRNYKFYTDYAFRAEYMSFRNFRRKRSYINLDYIYGTLSNEGGEYPLDFRAIAASPKQMEVVTTNALTGKAVYFGKADMKQDNYDIIKASSCVPVVNEPYMINGVPYFDGGMSDPAPINRPFRRGCDKVVLILTRPRDFYRSAKNDVRLARILAARYPKSAYRLAHRSDIYNAELDLAKKYEKRGKVLILAPKDIAGMKTLKKDLNAMKHMYQEGYEDARQIRAFLES